MTENLVRLYTDRLESLGLEYAVTGSVAAIIYGEPRLTNDLDLILDLPGGTESTLAAGFPESDFYCPATETLEIEARRRQRGHFNLLHHQTGFKADVYLAGQDPLLRLALREARPLPLGQTRLRVAPAGYVILKKLEYFREGGSEKHLTDIRGILRHSPDLVDVAWLEAEVARHGLGPEWARAKP